MTLSHGMEETDVFDCVAFCVTICYDIKNVTVKNKVLNSYEKGKVAAIWQREVQM